MYQFPYHLFVLVLYCVKLFLMSGYCVALSTLKVLSSFTGSKCEYFR